MTFGGVDDDDDDDDVDAVRCAGGSDVHDKLRACASSCGGETAARSSRDDPTRGPPSDDLAGDVSAVELWDSGTPREPLHRAPTRT